MRLRKWVRVVLVILSLLALIICASDCEDLHIFIVSHMLAIVVFIASTSILLWRCYNEDIY